MTKGGLADGKVAVDDTILAVNGFDCLPEAHATIVDVFRTASTIELRMAKIPGAVFTHALFQVHLCPMIICR